MKEAFEKILERLEELRQEQIKELCEHKDFTSEMQSMRGHNILQGAKKIVQEVAEEYNNGWIAFGDAIEIVKQAASEDNNGWIPCSERLPDKNGMYLCTQNTYDLNTNKKIIKISTELVEFYNENWRRAKNLIITHWQPLPEPYQPKGE